MLVLGLDVSSVSTGCCVLDDGYILMETLQTINPNKKNTMGQKLLFFEKELKKIIKKHKPDFIVCEEIFRGPNIKTFKTLSMFRGVCFKAVFESIKKDPITIMPTEARRMVGVNGSSKEDAFDFITKKYKLDDFCYKDNDIADAIVLALAGWRLLTGKIKREEPKKKKQKRKKEKK